MVLEEVGAPDGVWRVGRAPDPLALPDPVPRSLPDKPGLGNRFDSPAGTYRTLYFSTTLAGCYGETLARFRPGFIKTARSPTACASSMWSPGRPARCCAASSARFWPSTVSRI